jgi:hypothetical protein
VTSTAKAQGRKETQRKAKKKEKATKRKEKFNEFLCGPLRLCAFAVQSTK